VIDYKDAEELIKRSEKALSALQNDQPATWAALQAMGFIADVEERVKSSSCFRDKARNMSICSAIFAISSRSCAIRFWKQIKS